MEEKFEYTYCAPRNNEVRQIREKYLPKEMTKLEQLREMDKNATRRGRAVSLTHGIAYALLLGIGMSCTMVWGGSLFVPGILIGCVGLAGVAVTYPVYRHIVKQDRDKIAPEILHLCEELHFGT